MIGYPISLFKLERRENSNKELTHLLDKVPVFSIKEASHFNINLNAREDFDAITKNNIFNVDLFAGEWFYAATIVSASPEKAYSIGFDVSMDFKARNVSRIKFMKRANSLSGVNLNIDENIDQTNDINLKEAITIPAKYNDYRISRNGNQLELREEEVGDGHSERRAYQERKYVELDLAKVVSVLTRSQSGTGGGSFLQTHDSILESLEMARDYMAFVVYYPSDKVKIRYAFRKAHNPLEGRSYFSDDQKIFGFFKTKKFAILNHRYERESDQEKLTKLNRFYPKNHKITYFFSKSTPEYLKEIGRKAIQSWDSAFKKAETGITVELDETKTVNLGDIRYNIINMVDSKDGARLLGYGPSIVDSQSGEIISATANIYANPFRESWISIIRNYIRFKLGMFQEDQIETMSPVRMIFNDDYFEPLFKKMKKGKFGNYQSSWDNENQEPNRKVYDTAPQAITLPPNKEFAGENTIAQLIRIHERFKKLNLNKRDKKGLFHINSFNHSYRGAISAIEKNCGNELGVYIKNLKIDNVTHNINELEIINKCADILLKDSVLSTLVHEIGHNVGLRHNFMASTDSENYLTDSEGRVLSKTSSSMDYQIGHIDETKAPAPYDTAALRFGYGNKILLENGKVKNIDITKSIKEQMKNSEIKIKNYKFCTDQDVQRVTPLCQRWDHGSNPLEIAKTIINNFKSNYTLYGHRYDRATGSDSFRFSYYHLIRTFLPLKSIYDQWRFYLREFVGEKDQYLHRYNEKDFYNVDNGILLKMSKDSGKYGQHYKEYYEASKEIFKFFKNIIFTPAKTCVTRPLNGVNNFTRLIDFEDLKEELFKSTSLVVTKCEDPELISNLESKGLTLVGEFGTHFEPQMHSLDILDKDYTKTDIVGFKDIKEMALLTFTLRFPLMEHLWQKEFAPNFLDNPLYRRDMLEQAYSRIYYGLNARPYGFNYSREKVWFMHFAREKNYLKSLVINLVRNMNVPGNLEVTDERRSQVAPKISPFIGLIPEKNIVSTTFRDISIYSEVEDPDQVPLVSAASLIIKRNFVKNTLGIIENNLTLVSKEEFLKEVEILKKEGIFYDEEELLADSFTLQMFLEAVGKLAIYLMPEDMRAKLNIKRPISQYSAEILSNIYNPIIEKLAPLFQKANRDPKFKDLANKSLSDFINHHPEILEQFSIEKDFYKSLTLEFLNNQDDIVILIISKINKEIEKAKKLEHKRNDLEAQVDILTEVLLSI